MLIDLERMISRLPAAAFQYESEELVDMITNEVQGMMQTTAELSSDFLVGNSPFALVPVGSPDIIIHADGTGMMVHKAFRIDEDGQHGLHLLILGPTRLPADSFICKNAIEDEV